MSFSASRNWPSTRYASPRRANASASSCGAPASWHKRIASVQYRVAAVMSPGPESGGAAPQQVQYRLSVLLSAGPGRRNLAEQGERRTD